MTHTYVTLAISKAAFEEIRQRLEAVGYGDMFTLRQHDVVQIDMHGIALEVEVKQKSDG